MAIREGIQAAEAICNASKPNNISMNSLLTYVVFSKLHMAIREDVQAAEAICNYCFLSILI